MPLSQRHKRRLVPLIIILASLSFWRWARERPHPTPEKVSHGTAVNPIAALLRPLGNVARQDGVAAAILVDTSGSMDDKVRDAGGELRTKIEIARRAVSDLIRQIERFSREHADRKILAGIYEFSVRERQPSCRKLIGLAPPDFAAAEAALGRIQAKGGTPIGDAMIAAKLDLDATGLSRRHLLVVTDGENTHGYSPSDVAAVISAQAEGERASIYFVAFDIGAEKFNTVKDAGGMVLAASNAVELNQTLDYLLTGKILAEQPATPPAK